MKKSRLQFARILFKKKNLKKKTTKQFGPKNWNLCRNILRLCKFKFVHIMITGRVTLGSENMETNEKKNYDTVFSKTI